MLADARDFDARALAASDASPLGRADLARRVASLEACDAWWLEERERRQLTGLLDGLRAHTRLLDHTGGQHQGCLPLPGGSTTLAVNTLVLQAHGRSDEALAAAAAACAGDPGSAFARHARAQVVRARAEAAELERLRDADGRACAVEALQQVARGWYGRAIDAGDRTALDQLAPLAGRLAPDLRSALTRGKLAAIEERASLWAATDDVGASRAALTRLCQLLRSPPAVDPGPVVLEQLDGDLGEAVSAWRAEPSPGTARRAIELESGAWYELGHATQLPPELIRAAVGLANSEHIFAEEAPPLACVLLSLRTSGLVDGPGAVPRKGEVILRRLLQARDELARLTEPTRALEHARSAFVLARHADRLEAAIRLTADSRVLSVELGGEPSEVSRLAAQLGALAEGAAELDRRLATAEDPLARARLSDVLADLMTTMISSCLRAGEPADAVLPLARRAFEFWSEHRTYVFSERRTDGEADIVARLLESSGVQDDAAHARLLRARDRRR